MSWRIGAAVVAVVVIVAGAALFEPWRLFTSSRVDEALPTASPPMSESPTTEAPKTRTPGRERTPDVAVPAEETEPPEPVQLARGEFEDAEHGTTGTARIIELADGRRFVRLEGLATSDGPDLHVWLSDAPSGGEWGSYDDGSYVRLGELTATQGNQNYEIPGDARIADMTSVVIWCDRFDVAFGTAPIELETA